MSEIRILRQSDFCHELIGRLNHDIHTDSKIVSPYTYGNRMKNYTQKIADIKRIRRELLLLQKLLEE